MARGGAASLPETSSDCACALAAGSFPQTKTAGLKVSTRRRRRPISSGVEQHTCSADLPVCAERPVCNHKRTIRHSKRALSSLDLSLRIHHGSAQPCSAVKAQQRSLRRLRNAALERQKAHERAEKGRQQRATSKWQHAHYTGTDAADDGNDNDTYRTPRRKRYWLYSRLSRGAGRNSSRQAGGRSGCGPRRGTKPLRGAGLTRLTLSWRQRIGL